MEQIAACQPVKQSQPTMYDKKRWNRGGDHSETQWYCPPDVGALSPIVSTMEMIISPDDATHMEAISAIDK